MPRLHRNGRNPIPQPPLPKAIGVLVPRRTPLRTLIRILASPGAPLSKLIHLLSLPLFALCLSSLPTRASAQRFEGLEEQQLEQQGPSDRETAQKWSVTLGAGIAAVPDYPGATRYRTRLVPIGSVVYDRFLFLSPFGLGITLIHTNGFSAGPILGYQGGRNQEDNTRLAGLGDIPSSVTAGVFARYRVLPFEITGTARQAITHRGNGLTGLIQLNYVARADERKLNLTFGPHLELANAEYERTWFGIDAGQSAQSGLPVYTPGGGIRDIGFHAGLSYRYSEHVFIRLFAAIKQLTSNAADSPVVQTRAQGFAGIGAAYHF